MLAKNKILKNYTNLLNSPKNISFHLTMGRNYFLETNKNTEKVSQENACSAN